MLIKDPKTVAGTVSVHVGRSALLETRTLLCCYFMMYAVGCKKVFSYRNRNTTIVQLTSLCILHVHALIPPFPELQALAEIIGPYGIRFMGEKLMEQVSGQVQMQLHVVYSPLPTYSHPSQ